MDMRLAASSAAHICIAAGRAADDQYASGESPADRRGTRRRSRRATAHALSATPSIVRTTAGDDMPFGVVIVGLITKCATRANRSTPVTSAAWIRRIVLAGAGMAWGVVMSDGMSRSRTRWENQTRRS